MENQMRIKQEERLAEDRRWGCDGVRSGSPPPSSPRAYSTVSDGLGLRHSTGQPVIVPPFVIIDRLTRYKTVAYPQIDEFLSLGTSPLLTTRTTTGPFL